ncbi:fasciclin domain-containing protein, partial [Methanoculleus sp.]|uniref:fasciclin domain-containing protein n=1 Tax=Methanoculleus sp. TaxID=90427 RepID=UPI0025FB8299
VNVTPTPTVNVTPTPTVNVTPTPTVNVTPTPTVNVTPTPTAEANVTIIEPMEGASIPAGNVTVSVNVTNFTLVEPTGQENAPGEGHLHYYLDAPIPMNESEPAIPPTGGYVISTNLSHTWENVTAGEHNLTVQLVNNDHTPLIPLAFETVNVTVEENVTPTPTVNVTPTPTVNVTPTPTPVVNITDLIAMELAGEENLTTFVEVVNNSTLDQSLEENRTYIICAPTNVAFEDLGNETLSIILNNTTVLNTILEYHVILGDYTVEELVMLCQNATDGQISLPTVEGTEVNATITDDGQLIINNFTVVDQIQITNNIIVYVIDGVLIPPDVTIPTPTPTPTPTMNVTPTPTMNVTPTPTMTPTPPTGEIMDLELYEGWNFISIPRPLSAGNNTAASVFSEVDTGGRLIYTFAPATGFTPVGENETLEVLEGYWVYSTEDTTMELNLSTNPLRAPAMRTLSPGWNAIGYSDLTARTAEETLGSVEDIWVYVVGFDAENQSYRPAFINNQTGEQGEDQQLNPTEGYWLFVREDGRLAAIST